jgi:hypothetical protein
MGALKVVQNWHTALNQGKVDEMVALVQPDVEVGGPRGSTKGADIVREWFGRANVRLNPLQFFSTEYIVVVEELGEWLAENGEVLSIQVVATHFTVADGLISRIMRYDNLQTALEHAGLKETDKVIVE